MIRDVYLYLIGFIFGDFVDYAHVYHNMGLIFLQLVYYIFSIKQFSLYTTKLMLNKIFCILLSLFSPFCKLRSLYAVIFVEIFAAGPF